MRRFLICASVLCALASAAPAQTLIDGTSIPALRDLIAERSPDAIVDTDGEGRLFIAAQQDGWNYDVQFYNCDGNKDCGMMQYVAQFTTNGSYRPQQALDWHSSWVWGRIVFHDNDVAIEMPINLSGGVSLENFRDTHDLWLTIMDDFVTEIGWGYTPPPK